MPRQPTPPAGPPASAEVNKWRGSLPRPAVDDINAGDAFDDINALTSAADDLELVDIGRRPSHAAKTRAGAAAAAADDDGAAAAAAAADPAAAEAAKKQAAAAARRASRKKRSATARRRPQPYAAREAPRMAGGSMASRLYSGTPAADADDADAQDKAAQHDDGAAQHKGDRPEQYSPSKLGDKSETCRRDTDLAAERFLSAMATSDAADPDPRSGVDREAEQQSLRDMLVSRPDGAYGMGGGHHRKVGMGRGGGDDGSPVRPRQKWTGAGAGAGASEAKASPGGSSPGAKF